MCNEGIHHELADIFTEFDRHSQITNTKYSIDADYPMMQGYTLLDCPDFNGFIRHIINYAKNKPVNTWINGKNISYDNLDNREFKIPRQRNDLIVFTVTPIQESKMHAERGETETTLQFDGDPQELRKLADTLEKMGVDQVKVAVAYDRKITKPGAVGEARYKFPPSKHVRRINPRHNSRIKRAGPFAFESFEERLKQSIQEEIGMVDQEVLFTKHMHTSSDEEEKDVEELEELEELKENANNKLSLWIRLLEESTDEALSANLEELIENQTKMIQHLQKVINERTTKA